MEQDELYRRLVQRYKDNTASQEEVELFFHLLQQNKLDAYLDDSSLADEALVIPIINGEKKKLAKSYKLLRYLAVASVLIALVTTGILFATSKKGINNAESITLAVPQALPGSKKAILTLSDGKKISLGDSSQTIRDGSISMEQKNNELLYKKTAANTPVAYHTIATPLGGEYQLTLPDGSEVWLNAGTSLTYPVSFNGTERRVVLSGEAYFEVARNAGQPFVVEADASEIKVLGTHFNVMAYAGEELQKTTLAEGSVTVSNKGKQQLLKPGEAAIVAKASGQMQVATANVEQDIAWKNGNFYFDKTMLASIMKQIGRWYNLEISYAGPVPQKRFVGRISRHTNLSDVLDVLRLSGVKFSMKERTLIVQN